MRYRENKPVEAVLAWLKEQNCAISRGSYHEFMARVLHLLPLEQARQLGVDVDFLRAVRVRYKLPADPKRVRRVIGKKPAPRHSSRAKRRKIGLPRKPKPAPNPHAVPNVPRQSRSDSAQQPFLGIEAEASARPRLFGDPSKPETLRYTDWKIINEEARTKIAKQNRQILTNDAGTVFSFKTGKQYTEEALMREFGLTLAEARSCFLTLDT